MWQALVRTASQLLNDLHRTLLRHRRAPGGAMPQPSTNGKAGSRVYQPLERVILADGVGHTLFEEYAAHRKEARGDEETGWLLLGLREENSAVVLATLPAGMLRDASVSHVLFNSMAQAIGSRIVRQRDRRLVMLGVVHTHPGSLRHPSDADYRGDSRWVRQLRGREGVFGIGTADGDGSDGSLFVEQPRPSVQRLGELSLSWYALGEGDATYRPLAVEVTLGPDLARPLHNIWLTIETHAERLERICRQQTGVTFEPATDEGGAHLAVNVPLAEEGTSLRILLQNEKVRYFLRRGDEILTTDCDEERIDRGVYLLLAELAAQG
jgi:proteasome lid subunit RPN8/RPN11